MLYAYTIESKIEIQDRKNWGDNRRAIPSSFLGCKIMVELLKAVGVVAGIGGITIGTFLILFREVIRKKIFSTLTKSDSYRLMRWIIILVWSVALAGIIAYVYMATLKAQTIIFYGGSVKDAVTKRAISDAEISFIGRPHIALQKTDRNGNFFIPLETVSDGFRGKVQVTHLGYEGWVKELNLTASATEEILLGEKFQEFKLSGEVRDKKGVIEGARISVVGKDVMAYSNKNGIFHVNVTRRYNESLRLNADKEGYRSWSEYVEAEEGVRIILERE